MASAAPPWEEDGPSHWIGDGWSQMYESKKPSDEIHPSIVVDIWKPKFTFSSLLGLPFLHEISKDVVFQQGAKTHCFGFLMSFSNWCQGLMLGGNYTSIFMLKL